MKSKTWLKLADEFTKMLFALLCGGILGIERGRKKRATGMRTYMLVCLGATLVMMTNQYISVKYNTGDVARMGAQVISGIGYYEGAVLGTIMIYLVMVVLHKFDNRLHANTKTMILYVEFKKMLAIRRLTTYVRENQIEVKDITVESPDDSKLARAVSVVMLRLPKKIIHTELLEQIENLEGIIYVEEL